MLLIMYCSLLKHSYIFCFCIDDNIIALSPSAGLCIDPHLLLLGIYNVDFRLLVSDSVVES